MQISTFSNIFNINIFACKCFWYVNNWHLQRKKKPNTKEWELLSSIKQRGLTFSVLKCPCSVAQFTHPSFGSVQLLFEIFYELTWSIWTPPTTTSPIFQMKHLEALLKPASAAQALLLPATSPFGPCAASSGAQPRHAPGWQEDANWSSASFPHWHPNGFAGMLQGTAQGWSAGALQLPNTKRQTENKTDIAYRAGKVLADKVQENHVYDFLVYYRSW